MSSPLKGRSRRYSIGIDTPMYSGVVKAWPKQRAIERAEAIVASEGGSAVVGRVWTDGVFEVVHEAYRPAPDPPSLGIDIDDSPVAGL